MNLPLVVIVGPTATGKTDVSIEVAKRVKGEIISADSMLIYRHMDIGTAKPTLAERQGIPHYMIDIIDPDQEYSVALYQKNVEHLITEIHGRGHLPILVGGTGLYVRSVIDHYNFIPDIVDNDFRQKLEQEAAELGADVLHRRLAAVDPKSAGKLHPHDLRRVIRALEVYHQTGRPISDYHDLSGQPPKFHLLMFGLIRAREALYRRIEARVDQMMAAGLVEEVAGLRQKYGNMATAMQGLGYKEVAAYLAGTVSLTEAVELLKRNTRRFAKRQLTWFRPDQRIKWINLEYNSIIMAADEITTAIAGEFQAMSNIP